LGKDLQAGKNDLFPRIENHYGALTSKQIDVRDGKIAALHHDESGFNGRKGQDIRPKSYDKATSYLLNVQVEGGEPLLTASLPDGQPTAIMSRFKVKQGEIILMVQGKIFSAHTLHCLREEPVEANRPAYELEISLMEWLVSNPPMTETEAPQTPPTVEPSTDEPSPVEPSPHR
jgi:hypothetical protein